MQNSPRGAPPRDPAPQESEGRGHRIDVRRAARSLAGRVAVLVALAAVGASFLPITGTRAPAPAAPRVGTIRFLGTESTPHTTRVILRGSSPIEVIGEIRTSDRLVVLLAGIDADRGDREMTPGAPGIDLLHLEPGALLDGRRLVRLRLEGIRKGRHSVVGEGSEVQVVLRDPEPGPPRRGEGALR